jgi:hypothetical protein
VGGGSWLRIGGGITATGCFFAAQPAGCPIHSRTLRMSGRCVPRSSSDFSIERRSSSTVIVDTDKMGTKLTHSQKTRMCGAPGGTI